MGNTYDTIKVEGASAATAAPPAFSQFLSSDAKFKLEAEGLTSVSFNSTVTAQRYYADFLSEARKQGITVQPAVGSDPGYNPTGGNGISQLHTGAKSNIFWVKDDVLEKMGYRPEASTGPRPELTPSAKADRLSKVFGTGVMLDNRNDYVLQIPTDAKPDLFQQALVEKLVLTDAEKAKISQVYALSSRQFPQNPEAHKGPEYAQPCGGIVIPSEFLDRPAVISNISPDVVDGIHKNTKDGKIGTYFRSVIREGLTGP
jgi:hypothetical protein